MRETAAVFGKAYEVEWYHGTKPFRLYADERAFYMCLQASGGKEVKSRSLE